jgi:hypothetical protein
LLFYHHQLPSGCGEAAVLVLEGLGEPAHLSCGG